MTSEMSLRPMQSNAKSLVKFHLFCEKKHFTEIIPPPKNEWLNVLSVVGPRSNAYVMNREWLFGRRLVVVANTSPKKFLLVSTVVQHRSLKVFKNISWLKINSLPALICHSNYRVRALIDISFYLTWRHLFHALASEGIATECDEPCWWFANVGMLAKNFRTSHCCGPFKNLSSNVVWLLPQQCCALNIEQCYA